MKNYLVKYIYILVLSFLFLGCGADSDFLRDVADDVSSTSVPQGTIYSQFEKGLYKYEMINEQQLGFTFLSVDQNCNSNNCSLFKQKYTFIDNNISIYNQEINQVVLSINGWLDVSSEDECDAKFTDLNVEISCDDGKKEYIETEENSLSELSILGVFLDITIEKIKDTLATFKSNSIQNTLSSTIKNDINSSSRYIIDIEKSLIIYSDAQYTTKANSSVLDSYSNLYMKINGYDLIFKDLTLDTSSIEIYLDGVGVSDFGSAPVWKKQIVYDNYIIIELSMIKN